MSGFQRPHIGRAVLCTAYLLATVGLLVLAFDGILFDKFAIVGAAGATIVCLVALLFTGWGDLYLGIGAAWLYACLIEMLRGPGDKDRAGLGLVFLAFALGALAAYTAWRREAPLRV